MEPSYIHNYIWFSPVDLSHSILFLNQLEEPRKGKGRGFSPPPEWAPKIIVGPWYSTYCAQWISALIIIVWLQFFSFWTFYLN